MTTKRETRKPSGKQLELFGKTLLLKSGQRTITEYSAEISEMK